MLRSIRRPVLALTAAVAIAAAACDSGDTPTDPSDPDQTPSTVTETFSGSLTVNGAQSFSFSVAAAGRVTTTLSAITPDGTVVGLALGTWNGTLCQIELANDNAGRGITVTGETSSGGNLCTRIYDIGQLAGPTTFTVTVVHP